MKIKVAERKEKGLSIKVITEKRLQTPLPTLPNTHFPA